MLVGQLDIWTFGPQTQACASEPLILPCVQKKIENQLSQFSESSLLVATSNNQYVEEITLCEWFDVIFRRNVFHAQLVDCGPGKTAKWCV